MTTKRRDFAPVPVVPVTGHLSLPAILNGVFGAAFEFARTRRHT